MSVPEFNARRSSAIRDGLQDIVLDARRRRRAAVRRWAARGAFGVAGLAVGVAVSGAAWAGGLIGDAQVNPTSAIVGPEGVTPGTPVITMLGDPGSRTIDGVGQVSLETHPSGATHVRVWITCLTAGLTYWGLDAGGNNPSVSCAAGDVGNVTWYDFDLAGGTVLYISAHPGVRSTIAYQFEHQQPTEWGVNAAGQTFGAATDAGDPDLLAVVGTADDGSTVEGYAFSSELASGPVEQPSNPDEVDEYNEKIAELATEYPDGYPVPVYLSDGITRIGTFYIQLG